MSVRALAAIVAGATLLGATAAIADARVGTSGTSPAKTVPTVPEPTPTTTASGVSTTGGEADLADTGIALRARASLPEFLPVVNAIVGTTSDIAGELGTLADIPRGILTPRGASIRAFSVTYDASEERYVATATFVSDATAEDAVAFFQATLTSAGFALTADEVSDASGRSLTFVDPRSPYLGSAIDIDVTSGQRAEIDLTVTDHAEPSVLQAFTGWAAGLPTLTDATPIEGALTVEVNGAANSLTLTLGTLFGYDGATPAELAESVRSTLPSGGFSLDPEDDAGSGTTLVLRHVAINDLTCEIAGADAQSATMWLSGTITIPL